MGCWGRIVVLGVAWAITAPAFAQDAPGTDEERQAPVERLPIADPPSFEGTAPEDGEEEEPSGVKLAIPVFRLAFGTAQSIEPGSLGGFAFDVVVGSRLAFQPLGERSESEDEGEWAPALTGELGYSRRGGDFGSHDLTVGIGFGFQSMYLGVHLFEAVTFGVDGNRRFGLRTTGRVDTLWGFLFLDIGHEVGFVGGATTHEIRGLLGVDVGLLVAAISIGRLFS